MKTFIICCLLCLAGTAMAAGTKTLRFEAEDYTVPIDAWLTNRHTQDKWNLWSTDKNAEHWSGGVVLQGPITREDRTPGDDGGAPVLHTVVKGIPRGEYQVNMCGTRTIGISRDGKKWIPTEGGCVFEKVKVKSGKFELWVDDCYKNRSGKPGACYYDYLEFRPISEVTKNVYVKVDGWATKRREEKLDRGTVALKTAKGVYIGWRLLKNDPADMAFDVYCYDSTGTVQKVNDEPVVQTTDYLDANAPLECKGVMYAVCRSGSKPKKSDAVAVSDKAGNALAYVAIPLKGKKTRFQKIAIADLNGDGKLDYVIKHPSANIDPWYKFWKPSTDTFKLEAYTHDGKHLWTRDLGWAIERGIWYSPYVVADLDGDGKAEVAVKTGEGDPRDKDGKVRSGKEWLSIWDGMTGKDIAKVAWPSRQRFMERKRGYNYASRNQMAVAYLDGKTPCVIALRGTYNLMVAEAYMLQDGKLVDLWKYCNDGLPRKYWGQGEHFTHCIDVDGDGRDEVMLGSAMLDDNGEPLWSTGLGHNDAGYVGDHIPDRPGLEIYYIIETRADKNGMCMVDAKTGEIIWGYDKPTVHVHSAGMCADIDPIHPGAEGWGADSENHKVANGPWLWSAKGKLLAYKSPELPKSFDIQTVYWDADLQKECLFHRRPTDYQGEVVDQRYSGSRVLIADVTGDWREEIIVTVPGEIRIYSTTIPAMDRRVCLLQDRIYRGDVRMDSMGYTKIPTLSYNLISQSPNINMTVMKDKNGGRYCRVVVSASLESRLEGVLTVEGETLKEGGEVFGIDLAPGEMKVLRVDVPSSIKKGDKTDYINARLENRDGVMKARVPISVKEVPGKKYTTDLPRMEAEKFSAQGGGKVHIRTDKEYVSEKCISHWDNKGHWLEWTFDVATDGVYELGIRYATTANAVKRDLFIDGKKLGTLTFASTAGFGDTEYDWDILNVNKSTSQITVNLKAGRHTLKMDNANGKPLNLDFVSYRKISG